MDAYDSDSSLEDADSGIATNVLLGYATEQATDDSLSHLGGRPIWLNEDEPPSFALAQCKTCNGPMSLLLQLNGELPDKFPGHERQLYIWACRRKPCRRKPGSIRAIRATRASKNAAEPATKAQPKQAEEPAPKQDLGSVLFGGPAASQSAGNPFSSNPFSSPSPAASGNPFSSNPFTTSGSSTGGLAAKPSQKPVSDVAADLPATFADKARISASSQPIKTAKAEPVVAWPVEESKLGKAYPSYYLDAEYEYLSADATPTAPTPIQSALLDGDGEAGPSAGSAKEEKAYEDTHDKTFQRFADTLSQNPEQVLRYEYNGVPLLFSRNDDVGVALAGPLGGAGPRKGIPRCEACGAGRVFEVQLCPKTIEELEEGDEGPVLGEGMEWGTVIVGVCERDCGGEGLEGKTVYREEWCGVQWEEVVERRRK